ncbi:MAG: methyltransferase domain-containing protein [Lachnospiraceae bacterium]|nr:methyltransferase domain-containing protein [Lachnospiraceae bacterium]
MKEQIGKIILDYSKYPGEDFYSDGAVEDELLQIVKENGREDFPRIIEEKAEWPILYHLSAQRENIIDWIPFEKDAKVLEIGSGCGAITGALSKKAGSVTCVELSKKRSLVNAWRNRECENVTIHVGNFQDIEPDLPCDFDYICLIGVFEYGQSYMNTAKPYEDFLKLILKHLAENGRLLIAIENKLGMKYFAGCREDHLGSYFSGIENYPDGGGVRTFSRRGLEKIFAACGVKKYQFYYPYPDYKFMTTLYSDVYLPGKGELCNNLRNFDRDRMLLFNEKNAFDGVAEDGYFSVFSNSYLVVIGDKFEAKYVRCSNDRAPEYAVRTELVRTDAGRIFVRKYPFTPAADGHIRGMAASYKKLRKKYAGSGLRVNKCVLHDGEIPYAEFEYVPGRTLSDLFDECLKKNNRKAFQKVFCKYLELVRYNPDAAVHDFDMAFSNILVSRDGWTLIDYEWTFEREIPASELAFRAVYCYMLEDEKRSRLDLDWVLNELKFTREDAARCRKQEMEFQKFVTGQKRSMGELRELLGHKTMQPQKWLEKYRDADQVERVQIYEDRGSGYRENASYFLPDAYKEAGLIRFEIPVGSDVTRIRIDPAMDACIVKFREIFWNWERIPIENKKIMSTNGRLLKDSGGRTGCPSVVFPTVDPNISLNVAGLNQLPENVLSVKLEVVRVPLAMAKDMANAARILI